MAYRIFTDTSANLPTPWLKQHNIGLIPLSYTANGETVICADTELFDGATFYDSIKKGMRVTTSQVNPQSYLDAFEPVCKAGEDILFVGMSSGISGSFASAEIARRYLKELYPDRTIRLVDSLGASLGEGMLVRRAVEHPSEDVNEAADGLETYRDRVCQIFTVDDLMHLKRGGRLSGASAVFGSILHIKPLLKGSETGTIVPFGKVRGRQAVIGELAKRYDAWAVAPETQTVCISHGNCPEDVEILIGLLKKNRPPKDILVVEHEPVTGSYLGPGALALYFEADEDVRRKG